MARYSKARYFVQRGALVASGLALSALPAFATDDAATTAATTAISGVQAAAVTIGIAGVAAVAAVAIYPLILKWIPKIARRV